MTVETTTESRQPVVKPGFEQVLNSWTEIDLGRGGGAFCAYVNGEKVVDLWAGHARPGVEWTYETSTTLYSTTKALAAVCAQLLCDRGQLDVDAPVSTYWPEFAQAGKDSALVRHILNHTVGVLGLPDAGSLLDFDGNGWDDYDAIAERLAAATPAWEPGTRNSYHAISYGWLVGELVRRITGQTIGAFFRAEIAEPLGLELWIGAPENVQARSAELINADLDSAPEIVQWIQRSLMDSQRDPATPIGQQGVAMHGSSVIEQGASFFGKAAVRSAEIPGAGGIGTARGLARMFSMLSMGGEIDGNRFLSADSVRLFSTETVRGPAATWPDLRMPDGTALPAMTERWGLGYQLNDQSPTAAASFTSLDTSFGHTGLGGQLGFADPVNRVAVGFVRSHSAFDWGASDALTDALYACLDNPTD